MATTAPERMFEEEGGKTEPAFFSRSYFIIKVTISPELLKASYMTYCVELCHMGRPNFKEGWENE